MHACIAPEIRQFKAREFKKMVLVPSSWNMVFSSFYPRPFEEPFGLPSKDVHFTNGGFGSSSKPSKAPRTIT
jgi:hypothetical protein